MIHVAACLVILALTCVALTLISFLVPGAPRVDGLWVTGSCAALVTSGVLLWYVRRERM